MAITRGYTLITVIHSQSKGSPGNQTVISWIQLTSSIHYHLHAAADPACSSGMSSCQHLQNVWRICLQQKSKNNAARKWAKPWRLKLFRNITSFHWSWEDPELVNPIPRYELLPRNHGLVGGFGQIWDDPESSSVQHLIFQTTVMSDEELRWCGLASNHRQGWKNIRSDMLKCDLA